VPDTLHQRIRDGRLPIDRCIEIGLCLTDALGQLHRRGLVHRDIKPSNIIFVGGVPKLADVGLVTSLGEARSFVGTEGFIPPEGPGTPQADIYSLGIVLYGMSTGKSHQDFPEPLPDLTTRPENARWLDLDAIILKACQAEVGRRYQTAEEMHQELLLLQGGESVRESRTSKRRWGLARKIGFATLAALALLIASAPFLKGVKHDYKPGPEAARLYEKGQWHYNQLTAEDHGKAFQYIAQTIQADGKFIEPYGELTMLYFWGKLRPHLTDQERCQRTRAIADKILGIDATHAEGHLALSYSHFLSRDWRGAESEVQQAIKLNPKLPIAHYLYCYYLTMQLRTEEARREGQQAELLEPPASGRIAAIPAAWPFIAERRFDLAIAQLRKALDLDRSFGLGRLFLGKCYEAQGNYVEALEVWNTGDLLAGDDPPERVQAAYTALRQAYATFGVHGYCRKWIELIQGDPAHPEEPSMFPKHELPGYYALLGDKAKALDELEAQFDKPNFWPTIKFEPLFDSLHDEPRYQELVRRAGLVP
jgi:tetratricopeptide (TPR) repeat protein